METKKIDDGTLKRYTPPDVESDMNLAPFLSNDFETEDDDAALTGRFIRYTIAALKEEMKVDLDPVVLWPATFDLTYDIVKSLRKKLEAGESVRGFYRPAAAHSDHDDAIRFVETSRFLFDTLSTLIAEEFGCRFSWVDSDRGGLVVAEFS